MFWVQSTHHQEVNDANYTYAASGIVTLCKWLSCTTAKEGLWLFNPAGFVVPDGRIVFVQFYFDLLVLEYLFCLFSIANLDIWLAVHHNITCLLLPTWNTNTRNLCIKLVIIKKLMLPKSAIGLLAVMAFAPSWWKNPGSFGNIFSQKKTVQEFAVSLWIWCIRTGYWSPCSCCTDSRP